MAERTRRWLIDVGIAVGVAVLLCLRVAAPVETGAPDPGWASYALMVGMGVVLLLRRDQPSLTLLMSAGLLVAYYSVGSGVIGAVWPIAAALMNAAVYGRLRLAVVVAFSVLMGAGVWRFVFDPEDPTLATVNDMLSEMAVAAAVILAGAMIRSQRLLRSEMAAREEAVAAERDAEAREAVAEARLAIARDVHDVVAHGLAGIGVQARLAREVLNRDPEASRSAIDEIVDATGAAMLQLRATVGRLRGAPTGHAGPSLEEMVRAVAGVETHLVLDPELNLTGHPAGVVRDVVREALTNTVRHAQADHVWVTVNAEDGWVVATIRDDGIGGEAAEGHGLRGMRERVEAVHGYLDVGPVDDGFQVTVRIPR